MSVWPKIEAHMVTQQELRRVYEMSVSSLIDDKILREVVSKFIFIADLLKMHAGSPKLIELRNQLALAKDPKSKISAIDRIVNNIHSSGLYAQHFIKGKDKAEILMFLTELSSIRDPKAHKSLLDRIENAARSLSLGQTFSGSSSPRQQHALYGTIAFEGLVRANSTAIRDTKARYKAMEISPDCFTDKTILDLGCNMGHILFEAVAYGLPRCFGLEHNKLHVEIGNALAKYLGVDSTITLITADVRKLSSTFIKPLTELDTFDVVFSLAVDGYLGSSQSSYYTGLVEVTKEICYFEPNNHNREWNVDTVKALGFSRVRKVIVPYNITEGSKRDCFICHK